MNVQALLKYYENVSMGNIGKDLDEVDQIREYLDKMTDNGKDIVLSKMDENDFVNVIDVIENVVLASMLVEGKAHSLLLEKMSGSLRGFSHTLILSILGILADEEVI